MPSSAGASAGSALEAVGGKSRSRPSCEIVLSLSEAPLGAAGLPLAAAWLAGATAAASARGRTTAGSGAVGQRGHLGARAIVVQAGRERKAQQVSTQQAARRLVRDDQHGLERALQTEDDRLQAAHQVVHILLGAARALGIRGERRRRAEVARAERPAPLGVRVGVLGRHRSGDLPRCVHTRRHTRACRCAHHTTCMLHVRVCMCVACGGDLGGGGVI
eukprot:scaffold128136_cov61-Phaeocystis_antarctica.AAC.2